MAHKEQTDFVRGVKASMPHYFAGKRVLEVGSLIINGTVRELFSECNYTGLDLAPGKGVDVVCHVAAYVGDPDFDVVISCEALEHDRDWRSTLRRESELLKEGGLLILTWAGPDRPEHGTRRSEPASSPATTDWYFSPPILDVLSALMGESKWSDVCVHDGRDGQDCYLWARKDKSNRTNNKLIP